ncbi:MAG: hypothetical protein JOS17DRAFT_791397 [Linnemannia elongata]|nr:MAG: hypothetical protein JOS17DRAFT_791397 [Linnemannia elongata]
MPIGIWNLLHAIVRMATSRYIDTDDPLVDKLQSSARPHSEQERAPEGCADDSSQRRAAFRNFRDRAKPDYRAPALLYCFILHEYGVHEVEGCVSSQSNIESQLFEGFDSSKASLSESLHTTATPTASVNGINSVSGSARPILNGSGGASRRTIHTLNAPPSSVFSPGASQSPSQLPSNNPRVRDMRQGSTTSSNQQQLQQPQRRSQMIKDIILRGDDKLSHHLYPLDD